MLSRIRGLFIVVLLLLGSVCFAGDMQFEPGVYKAAIQEFEDFEKRIYSEDRIPATFIINENQDLIFTQDGEPGLIMKWVNDKWVWEFAAGKYTEATPSMNESTIIIDYVAFEDGVPVGGARFYLNKE